jgi:hypothetical protein
MDWSWLESTEESVEVFGPASEQELDEAEAQIGPFPPEYRDFVLSCGATRIRHRDVFGVHSSLPPYLDVAKETSYERSTPSRPLPSELIAVFNDGAGNLHCVRVDAESAPASQRDEVVVWWRDEDVAPEHVAETFSGWLRSLLEPDES